jgi:hypothetical protein
MRWAGFRQNCLRGNKIYHSKSWTQKAETTGTGTTTAATTMTTMMMPFISNRGSIGCRTNHYSQQSSVMIITSSRVGGSGRIKRSHQPSMTLKTLCHSQEKQISSTRWIFVLLHNKNGTR